MRSFTTVLCTVAALCVALPAMAAEPDAKTEKSKQAAGSETKAEESVSARPPVHPAPLVYTPPKLGKPARTVGGGSRGTSDKVPALYVLVPEHVGQTASAQPSLFWYIDRVPNADWKLEFSLIDEDSVKPLVEVTLPQPKAPGVYRIRLSDYDVKLKPGIEYEWSVSVVLDANERSKDVMAAGWIDRVEPSGLQARLSSVGSDGAARVYAEEGLWYDALASLSDQIDGNPGEPRLQQARADLLRQVGLDVAVSAGL